MKNNDIKYTNNPITSINLTHQNKTKNINKDKQCDSINNYKINKIKIKNKYK
jgi:hypothetical protein